MGAPLLHLTPSMIFSFGSGISWIGSMIAVFKNIHKILQSVLLSLNFLFIEMLSQKLHETLGRPKGTYISTLPSELRKLSYRYVTSCGYQVEIASHAEDPTIDINHEALIIHSQGMTLSLIFDLPLMKKNMEDINVFIRSIHETFDTFLTGVNDVPDVVPLTIQRNQTLDVDILHDTHKGLRVFILVYSKNRYTGINIEVCEELLEAMEFIAMRYNNYI